MGAVPPLTPAMMHLAADLLDKAGDEFGNHGCNDYPLPDWIGDAEALALNLAEHTWNGDPEEAETNPRRARYGCDFSLMHFLADVIRGAAGPVPPVNEEEKAAREAADREQNRRYEIRRAERDAREAAKRLERARAR